MPAIIVSAMSIFNLIPSIAPWGMDRPVGVYFAYYLFGNIMAEHRWIEIIRKVDLKYGTISTFVLISVNFWMSGYRWGETIAGISYVIAIIGIAGWVYMSVLIERYGGILEQIGQASLCILCLHVPVCEILTKIMVRITNMTFESSKSEVYYVFIRCAITLESCMICYYLILKVAPWMLGKKEKVK